MPLRYHHGTAEPLRIYSFARLPISIAFQITLLMKFNVPSRSAGVTTNHEGEKAHLLSPAFEGP
jgi:hypothetical protein